MNHNPWHPMLADALPVVIAALVTLAVQGALALQKYHFSNGIVLGVTLAAVDWYEVSARRKGLPQSRAALIVVAASGAGLTLILQQAAKVFTR